MRPRLASAVDFERTIKSLPGVTVLPSDDSIVSYFDVNHVIWNFSTTGSFAYPSVACRRVIDLDGNIRVETQLICNASQDACDRLAAAYVKLDKEMTDFLNKQN